MAVEPKWVTLGRQDIGFHEKGNNQGIGTFIQQAHCGQEGDPWCAIWANAKLEEAGFTGTRSAAAQSFRTNANFVKLNGPALGAIVVYWRTSPTSSQGHVGFYLGETGTQIATLGGNESDAVRIQFEPSMQLIGYWWPVKADPPELGVITVGDKDGQPVGSNQ
jgi:uncharacterized protein (TIGR02594 family)